jgi:hypothetical protein
VAKKKLTKKQRAALLRAKAARLEAEALEAESEEEEGGEEDGEEDDEDEDEDEEDEAGGALDIVRQVGGALAGPGAEGMLGALGGLGQLMNGMGVEQETPPDAEGNPGFKFRRHAGKVKRVQLDGQGNVKGMDFEPEEWPPRGESF